MLIYEIIIGILIALYVNTLFENRRLKKYIKERYENNKSQKPPNLEYGKKEV